MFAGHQDLLQGFKTYLAWENGIEYGTSNEPNTICATGDPVATNSNNDAMYSNPLLEFDTGTLGFVEGVNQLSPANGEPSVSLHDRTDALVSVLATYADVQGAPASDYSIMRDVSMPCRCDHFRSRTIVALSWMPQIKLASSICVKETY